MTSWHSECQAWSPRLRRHASRVLPRAFQSQPRGEQPQYRVALAGESALDGDSQFVWENHGVDPSERAVLVRALRVRMAELPGLTSNDLAAAVGSHPNGIYKLRCERRGPHAELLVRLARAVGVEPIRLVPPDRWSRLEGETRLDPAIAMCGLSAPDASHGRAAWTREQDQASRPTACPPPWPSRKRRSSGCGPGGTDCQTGAVS